MTNRESTPDLAGTAQEQTDQKLERWVGASLLRRAETLETAELLGRIQASRQQATATVTAAPRQAGVVSRRRLMRLGNRAWSRVWAWGTVGALALLLAFAGGRQFPPQSANAASLLRTMQTVHARPIDHCYRVHYTPHSAYWNRGNRLEGPSTSLLWTRGDRFWSECTIGDLQLKLGRDEQRTLWISPSSSKGIRFSNDGSRLPEAVAVLSAVNSMNVPLLVEEVLADFDLRADAAGEGGTSTSKIIWARLKPGRTHPLLSHAMLEIDPRTNVLNRLLLWTVRDEHPAGIVAYTLVESGTQTDDQYRLETHLQADAVIETHSLYTPVDETRFEE